MATNYDSSSKVKKALVTVVCFEAKCTYLHTGTGPVLDTYLT